VAADLGNKVLHSAIALHERLEFSGAGRVHVPTSGPYLGRCDLLRLVGEAVELGERRIDADLGAVEPMAVNAVDGVVEQAAIFRFGLEEGAFAQPVGGHIFDDDDTTLLRCGAHMDLDIAGLGDGDRCCAIIFAQHIEMVEPVHQIREWAADGNRIRQGQELAGLGVTNADARSGINHHDAVLYGFERKFQLLSGMGEAVIGGIKLIHHQLDGAVCAPAVFLILRVGERDQAQKFVDIERTAVCRGLANLAVKEAVHARHAARSVMVKTVMV
jgi:hypothetical protein